MSLSRISKKKEFNNLAKKYMIYMLMPDNLGIPLYPYSDIEFLYAHCCA